MEHDVQTQFVTAGSLLYEVEHRPWPPPDAQWLLSQSWNDLLMMHFAVDPQALRQLVPPGLTLELYDGVAWLTVMAFSASHARPSGVPPLPGISFFSQINLRTYVSAEDKPGVYYLSVDCGNLSAVWFARMFFRLQYWHSSIQVSGATLRPSKPNDGLIHLRARRQHGPATAGGPARLEVDYAPVGEVRPARQHTLDDFLAERYCVYSRRGQRYYRIEVHHQPWPLQRAEAAVKQNTLAEPMGLLLSAQPQLCHFSRSIKLLTWAPQRIASLG